MKMKWPRCCKWKWPRWLPALPVIRPDAKVKRYWDAVIFVAIFYSCNLTPILVATPPRTPFVMRRLRRIDFCIDILFLLDTFSGFCYAFVDPVRAFLLLCFASLS